MNLNDYARICHKANLNWWKNPKSGKFYNKKDILVRLAKIALIHTELSEATEGERKNCADDKLKCRKMAEVEMVDALIRILDYCDACGYDVETTFKEKMEYNRNRDDHKLKNRKLKTGKKF